MKNKGMDTKGRIIRILYRSFDGDLSSSEQRLLDNALKESEELRKEKERILKMREQLKDSGSVSFRSNFADRVIHLLDELPKRNGLENLYQTMISIFRRMAIATAVVMLMLLIYNIRIGDSLSEEDMFYASDTTVQEIMDLPLF